MSESKPEHTAANQAKIAADVEISGDPSRYSFYCPACGLRVFRVTTDTIDELRFDCLECGTEIEPACAIAISHDDLPEDVKPEELDSMPTGKIQARLRSLWEDRSADYAGVAPEIVHQTLADKLGFRLL